MTRVRYSPLSMPSFFYTTERFVSTKLNNTLNNMLKLNDNVERSNAYLEKLVVTR